MPIYPEHPYVHLFPAMADTEFEALVADIRQHGVRNPIVVTPDGYLIDGRHRQRACQALGIDAPAIAYTGDPDGLLDYVLSTNLQRRHLNPTQKAELANDLVKEPQFMARALPTYEAALDVERTAQEEHGRGTDEHREAHRVRISLEPLAQAAREVGASRTAAYAVHDAREEAPELAARISSGQVSARAAEDLMAVRRAAGEEAAAAATEALVAGNLNANRIRDITAAVRQVEQAGGDSAAARAAAARVAAGAPLQRVVHDHARASGLEANAARIATGAFFEDVTAADVGTFQTIVIDPPWRWSDENPEQDEDMYERGVPYATMTIPEIIDWDVTGLCRRPSEGGRGVGDLGAPDSHLYLWITNARLLEGKEIMEAWGYEYKTTLTWVKPRFGIGYYFRGQTEHILFGVRGRQELLNRNTGTWFAADRGAGGHSSKPDEFYELVERTSPGPWVDVFGRRHVRPGWSVIGVDSGDDPGSEAAVAAREARRTWRLVSEVPDGAEVAEAGVLVAGD